MDNFFTRDTLASALGLVGIAPTYWAKLAHNGDGPPYVVVGNRAYYDLAEVRAWLQSRMVDPSKSILRMPPKATPANDVGEPPKRRRGRPTKAEQARRGTKG